MGFSGSCHFALGCLSVLLSLGCAQDTGSDPPQNPPSLHSDSPLPDGVVRLRDGYQPYQGRVEIYYQGEWGTICDTTWSENAAIVLCRQLGFPAVASAQTSFGEGAGPIFLDGLNCGGYEDGLIDCPNNDWTGPSTCDHSQDVGVVCSDGQERTTPPPAALKDGSLRLADGTALHNGRVEIFYQGEWGTICRDPSDNMTANVVCRELGYTSADPPDAVPQGGFGPGSGVIHLGNVACDGTESKLVFCSHAPWGENECTHDDDFMVSCKTYTPPQDGSLRLVAGGAPESGQVEISYQGVWGTVCDTDWTIEDATVVCRQLGFKPARASLSYSYFLEVDSINPVFFDSISCTGFENRLEECQHQWRSGLCDHSEDVGVICGPPERFKPGSDKDEGRVRLSGGRYPHHGRVEIRYQGEWGTVCDQGWNTEAATVVCRQLGYPSADSALPRAFFGEGRKTILLDQVSCKGSESELVFCNHARWGNNNCDHSQDASVVCTAPTPEGATPDGSARLVGEESPLKGRLQVHYQGVWGTVCGDGWTSANSDVVCQQLGYPSGDPTLSYYVDSAEGSRAPIMLDEVTCTGMESRLVDCSHEGWAITDCSHKKDIGVICNNMTTTSAPRHGTTVGFTTIPLTSVRVTEFIAINVSIGDGKEGAVGQMDGDSGATTPSATTEAKGVLANIWVIIVLVAMVPIILIIFVIGLMVKKRFDAASYKPVDGRAMPMGEKV